AVINMLALLGWNPGTEKELFSLEELIYAFDIERVHKSGAKFNPEKTNWFQHQYIQRKDDKYFSNAMEQILEKKEIHSAINIDKLVKLIKERITFAEELWDQADFFFITPTIYDKKSMKKAVKENTEELLKEVDSILEYQEECKILILNNNIKNWIQKQKIGFGNVMMPLRLSLVGDMRGPDVFDI